jgi:hypothetical protein
MERHRVANDSISCYHAKLKQLGKKEAAKSDLFEQSTILFNPYEKKYELYL